MNRNITNPGVARPEEQGIIVVDGRSNLNHTPVRSAEDNHLFRELPRRLHETREILSAVANLCYTTAKFATTATLLYASFRTTIFLNAHPLASTLVITSLLMTLPTIIKEIIVTLYESKNLKAQNDALKTENTSLLAENADLKARNEHLRQELRDHGLELSDETDSLSDSDHQSESDTGSDED